MEHHGDKPQDQASAICLRLWHEGKAMRQGEVSAKSVRDVYKTAELMGDDWSRWIGRKAGSFPTKMDAELHKIILSTDAIDRDGERIMVSGWRNVSGTKVPLLYSHDNSNLFHALGTLMLESDGNRLLGTPNLAENDAGKAAQALMATGFEQFSVGFLPFLWSDDNGKSYVEREAGDPFPWPRKGRIFYDVEAVEGSLVPVPSNPQAVGLDTGELAKFLAEYFKAQPQDPRRDATISEWLQEGMLAK